MGASSELTMLASLAALAVTAAMFAAFVAWLVRLPPDALIAAASRAESPTPSSIPRRIARTALGIALVMLGVLLALPGVPGPGLVLVLLGFVIADLPGKRRAELHLLRRPRLVAPINRLRLRL